MQIDEVDVKGSLETIKNLAAIGMILIDLGKLEYIPTILEDVYEHSQRLTIDYASVEE